MRKREKLDVKKEKINSFVKVGCGTFTGDEKFYRLLATKM